LAVKLDCQLLWLLEENSEAKESDWLLVPLEDAELEPKTESIDGSDEEVPSSASAPPPPPPW
jgi:hypothetical protein